MKNRQRVLQLIRKAVAVPTQPTNPFRDEAGTKSFLESTFYSILKNAKFDKTMTPAMRDSLKDKIVSTLIDDTYRQFVRTVNSPTAPAGIEPKKLAFAVVSGMLWQLMRKSPKLAQKMELAETVDIFEKFAPIPVDSSMEIDGYLRNFSNPNRRIHYMNSLAAIPPMESNYTDETLMDRLYGFQKAWITNYFAKPNAKGQGSPWMGLEARRDTVTAGMIYLYITKLYELFSLLHTSKGQPAINVLKAKTGLEGDLKQLDFDYLYTLISTAKEMLHSDPTMSDELKKRSGSSSLDTAIANLVSFSSQNNETTKKDFEQELGSAMAYGRRQASQMQMGYLPPARSLQQQSFGEGNSTVEETTPNDEKSQLDAMLDEEVEELGRVPKEVEEAADKVFSDWSNIIKKELNSNLVEYRGAGEAGGVRSIRKAMMGFIEAPEDKRPLKQKAVQSLASRIASFFHASDEQEQRIVSSMYKTFMDHLSFALAKGSDGGFIHGTPYSGNAEVAGLVNSRIALENKQAEALLKQMVTPFKKGTVDVAEMTSLITRLKKINPARAAEYERMLTAPGPELAQKESQLKAIIGDTLSKASTGNASEWTANLAQVLNTFYDDLPIYDPEVKEDKKVKLIQTALQKIQKLISDSIQGRKYLEQLTKEQKLNPEGEGQGGF
jgi:hypothetical protein